MKPEEIEALFDRLASLPHDEFRSAVCKTFGGCEWMAQHAPRKRIGELFVVLNRHVTTAEQPKAAPATAAAA